jgi:hypothetical protein
VPPVGSTPRLDDDSATLVRPGAAQRDDVCAPARCFIVSLA